ncbi:MAG: hypothetical protein EA402_10135 [Planctomycetota bacterium]|nr:MAG: hypothetical protein EA402_10135 [Planctomycetota bacterium]
MVKVGLLILLGLSALSPLSALEAPPELVAQAKEHPGLHEHEDWWVMARRSGIKEHTPADARQMASGLARSQAADTLVQSWLFHHFAAEWRLVGPATPWLVSQAQLRLKIVDLEPREGAETVILAMHLPSNPASRLGHDSLLAWIHELGLETHPAAAEAALRIDPLDFRTRLALLHGAYGEQVTGPSPAGSPIAQRYSRLRSLMQLHERPDPAEGQAGHGQSYARALVDGREFSEAEMVLAVVDASFDWDKPWSRHGLMAGLAAPGSGSDDNLATWLKRATSALAEEEHLQALLALRRSLALGGDRSSLQPRLRALAEQLGLNHAAKELGSD